MREHSRVGLVTNSSSETYSYASDGAVERTIRLIDQILYAGGSVHRCEDLFDVTLERKSAYYVDIQLEWAAQEEDGYDWMTESFPDGLQRVVITPKFPGVEVDLGSLLEGIYDADYFSSD